MPFLTTDILSASGPVSKIQHEVKNGSGSTINIGTPVYVKSNGNSSTNMSVEVASNTMESTSSKTMGIMAQTTQNNGFGYIITEGLLAGINTSAANNGDPIWLGQNGQLIFGLANKPYAPAHLVFLGVVTRGQVVNGEIFVKVQNGFEVEELHNAKITNPQDGDVLKYQASTGMWINSRP